MKCPRCQTENDAGARFCEDCGARLEAACPSCGTPVTPGKKFCRSCGAALTIEPAGRFASPESYTPKHLAERILTSKAALEGERKQVTVLFADLKGSMELLANRDPEEARKILDPVLEHMMEAVHRYEGTVNQVMGDGVMALFGAPLAHEDHAVRACYAALRMQESVKRYSEEVRRQEGVLPQIRVGLNSGEVVVRSVGSDLHMDYTAVGQTTHLAARMEQSAAPGTALITAETLRLAEGYVHVSPLGPINVKGIAEAVQAYELTGAVAGRSRFQTLAARGLTKFVGRAAEMEQLSVALGQVRAGHGQVVAVVGEPGVGKSRLFWEFTHSHRTEGWLIVEAGSVSYGKATSYLPVIELLRAYFQIESRDDQRKIREKVTGKVFSLDRALEPSLPPLLALLDVPVEDEAWTRLDPPQQRQRTLDGVKRLLLRESQVQPLVVVFEDLHWIDSETQALLDTLIESLPTARLCLLVTYRPEFRHAWGSKTYYRQLRVDALPTASADELLDALLGSDPMLVDLKRVLIERTEGNPFFLEESVRTLLEAGVLSGQRGAYRLARASDALQIPATAQAVLAARIDRLDPEDKRVLQAAAVIGKDFAVPLLAAIADTADEPLNGALSRLQAAEFVYEATLFREVEYTFKHALTQEVAYTSVLHERRRVLHGRIVDAIEAMHRDRLTEHVERLAHHAVCAQAWDRAATFLRQASDKALSRSANRAAGTYIEQALAALSHVPETRAMLELAVDLRFELRQALYPLGEFERVRACLRDAERLAETLGDERRLGWAWAYLSHYYRQIANGLEARRFARKADAIAEMCRDWRLAALASFMLGFTYYDAGDLGQAAEFLRKTGAALEGERSRERLGMPAFPAVSSRNFLSHALALRGEFDQALGCAREALRLAEAIGHPYTLCMGLSGLGTVHEIRGDFAAAASLFERALGVSRQANLTLQSAILASGLGYVSLFLGRPDEGLASMKEALATLESIGWGGGHSSRVVHFAEGCALTGRFDEARAHAERAVSLARSRGGRGDEAHGLRVLGEIMSHHDPSASDGHYHEARALADELGMGPLVAHCHAGLGKLYRRIGKRIESDEHFATGTKMYREMGMTYWLEQTEREMSELA